MNGKAKGLIYFWPFPHSHTRSSALLFHVSMHFNENSITGKTDKLESSTSQGGRKQSNITEGNLFSFVPSRSSLVLIMDP